MKFLRHINDWLEAYFWLPLALMSVIGASWLYQAVTGGPVMENPVWLVGYAEKLVQLFLLLVVSTVVKQQTGGVWLTKDEKLGLMGQHQGYAICESLKIPFYMALSAYILLH